MSEFAKMTMNNTERDLHIMLNPYVYVVRVSATEILFVKGLVSKTFFLLKADDKKQADRLLELIDELKSRGLESRILKARWEELGGNPELLERFFEAKILVPSSLAKFLMFNDKLNSIKYRVLLLGHACRLTDKIYEYLAELGIGVERRYIKNDEYSVKELIDCVKTTARDILVVISMNRWSPFVLRKFDKYFREQSIPYIPVFVVFDIGVVGPLIEELGPCYMCFERTFESVLGDMALFIRAWSAEQDKSCRIEELPSVYIDMLASIASTVIAHVACGLEDILRSRAIIVSFPDIFISVMRIYRLPNCQCVKPSLRIEL